MSTLREISTKLHSIKNVKKITQAMEMVAGARFKKVQEQCARARPYLLELQLILNNLIAAADALSHALISPREVKRIAVVIIASDKGLCGAYNQNVLAKAKSFLKIYDPKNVDLFLLGQKAVSHFDNKEWTVKCKLTNCRDTITTDLVESLSHTLMESFQEGSVDEVWLVYTFFHNMMNRKVVQEKLLPIPLPALQKSESNKNYIFEPSEQEIFAALLPRYCSSKLRLAVYESITSELAARIVAMRAATKNANEIVNELTLERNKLRQASITRELIEVTSGAEASKSLF
jgi:F-type H+-transporting ATPase subunit gamma